MRYLRLSDCWYLIQASTTNDCATDVYYSPVSMTGNVDLSYDTVGGVPLSCSASFVPWNKGLYNNPHVGSKYF